MFSDRSKFNVIQKYPTLIPLKTVQNNGNAMFKRNKISEEKKKQLGPIATQLGSAHGLPKAQTYKAYANLPSFPPIIDTTSTSYYNIGKSLPSSLQQLTHNDYNLKDSFGAVKKIRPTPPPIYLTMITSLFLLMFSHYLPMCQLKRQSTSF